MGLIKTKEELTAKMVFYKKIYTKEIIEYYDSLLNLKISSLNRDYIPEDILNSLRHTEIYKDISRYNIYENAITTLEGDSRLKKLYTGKETLDVILPTKIVDYKVFSYDPALDEIMLFDLKIDEEYRINKIKDIENNKIAYLDEQIALVDSDIEKYIKNYGNKPFNLSVEKDQLTQSREMAKLEIKSLKERSSKEDYANSIKNIIGGYQKDFCDFYNIDPNIKVLKIGNTKVTNHTYHY